MYAKVYRVFPAPVRVLVYSREFALVSDSMLRSVFSVKISHQIADLIPLCHPIPVEAIKIDFDIEDNNINVLAIVSTSSKTGVEMEALMAVNIACLTIYDMIKSIDKHAKINSVKLISKSGGKSGDWKRK